ncbi:importin alpha [Anaeramoeba flamelloides]|uniref:Importin alpha n=1 Tax=Anaeramoeba flamelloides TaxID=1746091 RepID=A0ABQ8XYD9_9EUKA|nr:importin alpha [Anaeramoeba flamelloides]
MSNFSKKLSRRKKLFKNKLDRSDSLNRRRKNTLTYSCERRYNILFQKRKIDFYEIKSLLDLIKNSDQVEREMALISLKEIVSSKNPMFRELISYHTPRILVDILKNDEETETIRIEALWVVVNFACSTKRETTALFEAGVFEPLVQFLSCENSTYLQMPMDQNFETYQPLITTLIKLLDEDDKYIIRTCCLGLSNFAEKTDFFNEFLPNKIIFKIFEILIFQNSKIKDFKTAQSILVLISQLLKSIKNLKNENYIQDFFQFLQRNQIIAKLKNILLNTKKPKYICPDILQILRRFILLRFTELIPEIISSNILSIVYRYMGKSNSSFINNDNEEIMKNFNGNKKNDNNNHNNSNNNNTSDKTNNSKTLTINYELKHQLCWFLSRCFSICDLKQCVELLKQGTLKIICNVIKLENQLSILIPALKAINILIQFNIPPIIDYLDEKKILTIIEKLTYDNNNRINQLANDIINNVMELYSEMFENDKNTENNSLTFNFDLDLDLDLEIENTNKTKIVVENDTKLDPVFKIINHNINKNTNLNQKNFQIQSFHQSKNQQLKSFNEKLGVYHF